MENARFRNQYAEEYVSHSKEKQAYDFSKKVNQLQTLAQLIVNPKTNR